MPLFKDSCESFNLPQASLAYYPEFLSMSESQQLFSKILTETNWRHDDITVFGKVYKQPRLTALFSSKAKPYSYSNIIMQPEAFPDYLNKLKSKVESATGNSFNALLINLYRDGQDSNGWHADNEKELGKNPIIASLSLGQDRPFHFKHRTLKNERHQLLLKNGSLLIMSGEMQHYWLHQIAKTKKKIEPRINLTFRKLIS